jgi:hypothetical protein
MKGMDEESVAKKFRNVSATQDNIQSLALWVIHHKTHHEKIVDIWFKVLKQCKFMSGMLPCKVCLHSFFTAKMSHRLTMFYLCNDVVQNSKRKHAMCYKDQFKDVLKDATLLVRYIKFKPSSILNFKHKFFLSEMILFGLRLNECTLFGKSEVSMIRNSQMS